jgi:hypothetical protein
MLRSFRYGSTGPKVFIYFGQLIASHCGSSNTKNLLLAEKNKGGVTNIQKQDRKFRSLFGCSPEVVAEIWFELLQEEVRKV